MYFSLFCFLHQGSANRDIFVTLPDLAVTSFIMCHKDIIANCNVHILSAIKIIIFISGVTKDNKLAIKRGDPGMWVRAKDRTRYLTVNITT